MTVTKKSVKLEVLKPFTEKPTTVKNASRLDTLNGKTICEVAGGWRSDITFPVIRDVIQKRFPNVKFIPHTELPPCPNSFAYEALFDKIVESIKEKRCDAVLLGNGG